MLDGNKNRFALEPCRGTFGQDGDMKTLNTPATTSSLARSLLAIEPEANLVRRLRAGDDRAYEILVSEYGSRMLTVARRFLRCEHDAHDAVQDALVSALQAIRSFSAAARLSSWLHRIVVNVCLMKLRTRSHKHQVRLDDDLPIFDSPGKHARPVSQWSPEGCARACSAELKFHVRESIDRLPESYRTVLLLRDIEERDTKETARLLGESQANVKTRLHRARQALRARIEPLMLC
jgi:RNA polymerase sigma-70 factor (ECF subfamily)